MQLNVIELQVKNWKKMLDWVVNKVGFKIIAKEDHDQFVLVQGAGGAMIGIWGVKKRSAQKFTPYIKVKDLEGIVSNLKKKSVKVGRIEKPHWGKKAKLTDPEGNVYFLSQEE